MTPKRIEGTADYMGAEFRNANLMGASFDDVNMANVRITNANMHGALIEGYLRNAVIDGDLTGATINGLDFGELYQAEMLRRHPERARLVPADADGYRDALGFVDEMRARTLGRARALPEEALHRSTPDGDWSVVRNLRHLISAESGWALHVAFSEENAYHALGQPPTHNIEWERSQGVRDELEASLDEVVAAMDEHHARVVRRFDALTDDDLAQPTGGDHTVGQALRVYFEHEWDHHQQIARILDALEQGRM